MKFQQIRNATVKVTYGNQTFLVDPWLAPKGSSLSFEEVKDFFQVPDEKMLKPKMPLAELPMAREEILSHVDAYIVTHVHPDHLDADFEGNIAPYMDRSIPVYVQNEEDAAIFQKNGFQTVIVLAEEGTAFRNVILIKTPGKHGTEIPCGPSAGVIFKDANEKTLYIAGDTIWYEGVADTLTKYEPDVIVLNACAATLVKFGRLIMDDKDVAEVVKAMPKAKIIASHMDTVSHATLTRETLKEKLTEAGIDDKVLIPEDGETLIF